MKALEFLGAVVGFLLVCGSLGYLLSKWLDWSVDRNRRKNEAAQNARVREDFIRRQADHG